MSGGDRTRNADSWVVLDPRCQLLSIGTALYPGSSPRTALDLTARKLLLPRMRQASRDGVHRSETVSDDGRGFTCRVIPVRGPVSGIPLAVLGCYGPDPSAFPPEPLVGGWEWRVTPPGPEQQMRAYWSGSLYDVYAIPRPNTPGVEGIGSHYWEGPDFLDRLIVDSDRIGVRQVLDTLLTTPTDGLTTHTYRVHNPNSGETHRLRFAGRAYVADGGADRWLRGISMRIDDVADDEAEQPGPWTYLDAAFTVSADPLCAIDTVYEHIYLTSAAFGTLGIDLPPHRHLPDMTHPDDVTALRAWLAGAAANRSGSVGPLDVRLAGADGGWVRLRLTGTGMRLTEGEPHHVLCRVTVARDQ